jgi:hypothetical protein
MSFSAHEQTGIGTFGRGSGRHRKACLLDRSAGFSGKGPSLSSPIRNRKTVPRTGYRICAGTPQ